MKNFHLVFATILLFALPLSLNARDLTGPSVSSNGAFTIQWLPVGSTHSCHELAILIEGSEGYDEQLPVDAQQSKIDIVGLPEGRYFISLTGICDLDSDNGSWGRVAFGSLAVTVSGERSSTADENEIAGSGGVKKEPEFTDSRAIKNELSAWSSDEGWHCKVACTGETHSVIRTCNDRVRKLDGTYESCSSGVADELCAEGKPNNSVFCENDTEEFWTCDFSCPSGYDQVDNRWGSSNCRNGSERRCVLNTDPPEAVTLDGSGHRYDARIYISWDSVRHANSYKWKYSTQSSWRIAKDRRVSVGGVSSGNYVVQVKACNGYGCSDVRSKTVQASPPRAPSITSSTDNDLFSRDYTLSWIESRGARNYKWRESGASWNSTYETSVLIESLENGSYAFQVRGCNSVECGAVESITVEIDYEFPKPTPLPDDCELLNHYVGKACSSGVVGMAQTASETCGSCGYRSQPAGNPGCYDFYCGKN